PQLADEAAARFQRAGNAGDHPIRILHPVERGIRENGIELALKMKVLAIHDSDVETACARGRDLLGAGINPRDDAAERGELPRECAITAAEIENSLARLRSKQFHDRLAELRYEARIGG